MNIELAKQEYVVAVSGGVDSMVLLDLVFKKCGAENVIAAHFYHNQRPREEGDRDVAVIRHYCDIRGIKLIIEEYAGDAQSEADMRRARYAFLRKTLNGYGGKAILTAHHQDDLVETAIINLLRGTKGAGMVSIQNDGELLRPLLGFRKSELLDYAEQNDLSWHEDVTNQDTKYLRNYIRHNVMPKIEEAGKYEEVLNLITLQKSLQLAIEGIVQPSTSDELTRHDFIMYPHAVSLLVMHRFLGRNKSVTVSERLVNLATVFAKTAKRGSSMSLSKTLRIVVSNDGKLLRLEEVDLS